MSRKWWRNMPVGIVRTGWQGTSGGPGVTQLAFGGTTEGGTDWTASGAQAMVNAVRAFWDSIKASVPNNITLTVSPIVDVYDKVGGELVGSYVAATPPAAVLGTDAGSFSMASGIKLNWQTSVILNGRRVRGATFIVPSASNAFTADGIVVSATRTLLATAGATLIGAANTATHPMGVWSRPTTKTSNDGAFTAISAADASEKGAVLRGRRD